MRRRDLLKWGTGITASVLAFKSPFFQNSAVERSRTSTSPLKITQVESFVIRTPRDDIREEDLIQMPPVGSTTGGVGLWNRLDHSSPSRFRGYEQATLVKITTDQGIIGWGECHAPSAPRVHQRVIRDRLAPILIGQDARNVEPLWEKMYSTERLRGYATGSYTESIAGVDLALWDILGKYAGVPVYQLLGGKFREEIPIYATFSSTYTRTVTIDALVRNTLQALEQGFRVVKMSLRRGPETQDFERVAAVSQALKGKGQVCVDALGAFKLHEAIRVGRELDRLGNVGWFEDPLMPEDVSGYPILARSIDTPICAGEGMSNRFQFREILAARGVDIINPDVCRAGGITECQRIAALADTYGVFWTPHVSTGTAPYMAASIHLAASTPNCLIMELYGGNKHMGPFGNALLQEPLHFQSGYARVPERPGLGVEFNEKALAKVLLD